MSKEKTVRLMIRANAYPEQVAAFRAFIQDSATAIQENPTCLKFEAYADVKKPSQFTLVEQWQDQAALDANSASPLMAPLRENRTKWFKSIDVEVVEAL